MGWALLLRGRRDNCCAKSSVLHIVSLLEWRLLNWGSHLGVIVVALVLSPIHLRFYRGLRQRQPWTLDWIHLFATHFCRRPVLLLLPKYQLGHPEKYLLLWSKTYFLWIKVSKKTLYSILKTDARLKMLLFQIARYGSLIQKNAASRSCSRQLLACGCWLVAMVVTLQYAACDWQHYTQTLTSSRYDTFI